MSARQRPPPIRPPAFQRDGGAPLPAPLRSKMESSFGTDFGAVRVDQSQEPLPGDAQAYALGNRIRFAPGHYEPNTSKGQELLGHELAHVVQQRQGKVSGDVALGKHRGSTSSALENEADAMGRAAAQGNLVDPGPVPSAVTPQAEVVQMKPKIDESRTSSEKKKHPLSVLNENFKNQVKDYDYPIQNGASVKPSDFITNSHGLGDTIDRPKKVTAIVEGTRRTKGARKAEPPQSQIGNLGEHERAMFNRPVRSQYNYAGGHLVSDKILDTDSYRADNLAPQYREFNSPGYRVFETMAEKGAVEKKSGKTNLSVPIEMVVEVSYPEDSYTVDVADLVKWKILPNTVTQTDGKADSITIPRRVPNKWKAELKIDSAKYPDYVLPEKVVSAGPHEHFVGTHLAVEDVNHNPSLDRQASQAYAFGMESATQEVVKGAAKPVFRVGGKASEKFIGFQAYPRPEAIQPVGGTSTYKPSAPLYQPKFLGNSVSIKDFWEDASKKSKKRDRAYEELEEATNPKVRKLFEAAVTTQKSPPATRDDFSTFLDNNVLPKTKVKKDISVIKKLKTDTNIMDLT